MATGQVSSASGSRVWLVYENTPVQIFQLSAQVRPCSSISSRISSGIATVGCVSFNWMAIESGIDASVRPSLKCVAKISCKLAQTKKYCCLSRSSLPCGVESSGYSTRDKFFASTCSRTAAG